MKKIIFCFFLLGISMSRLFAQTSVEEMFYVSFDVDVETATLFRNKIIEKAPDSKFAMYCEGWFLTKRDSSKAAIIVADNLIKKYPDFLYGYLLKGNANYFLSNFNEAIKAYNKVIEINPKENGGYINRGECKYELADYKGAIADFDKALEIEPTAKDADYFSEVYYYRGLSKIKLSKKNEGCLDLNKAGDLGFKKAFDEIKKLCK